MPQTLTPDQPTADRMARWDRTRDEEFLRRLRQADEEIARRGIPATPEPRYNPAGWDPRDCL